MFSFSEVCAIAENSSVEAIYVLGDFNANPSKSFGSELTGMCIDQHWTCADIEMLDINSDTFTFVCDATGSTSWIDHCVVSCAAMQTLKGVKV